ncbi:MAG: hypothetical protein DCF15_19615 [Phormidesmis priestleyi]|uniref:MalT-like TPR region domain-containing protein n=1 Tax=Phormidesmis priestleyi TaxID=268141 RepID=A0A2W4YVY1_9CYAN|nr:MAG: hypothetical protein DCF15_19615 [Phormidesmis priestleyi]
MWVRCCTSQGYYRDALAKHEEHFALTQTISDRWGERQSLANLGRVHLALGDTDVALAYLEKSATLAGEIQDNLGQGQTLIYEGDVSAFKGDLRGAIAQYTGKRDFCESGRFLQ